MYYQFKLNGYTIQDLLVLCRVTAKRYRRGRTLLHRTVYVLAGLALLATGVLLLLDAILQEGDSLLLGVVLLAAGLLYLGLGIFYHRLTAWRSHRMQLRDMGEITVTLDDAGVREQGKKGEGFYPYSSFIGCFHSRGRYLLFLDKKHAVILPEQAVTVGDPAALGGKLAEKFGGVPPEV